MVTELSLDDLTAELEQRDKITRLDQGEMIYKLDKRVNKIKVEQMKS